MKKVKKLIRKTSFILLVIATTSVPITTFARAGGGSSSSGSSGSSSSFSSRSSRRYKQHPLVGFSVWGGVVLASTIGVKAKLKRKKKESVSKIKNLANNDANWNYDDIKRDIEDAFYNVNTAWMERNQDLAKEHMSNRIYEKHKSQTQWMEVKKEKNILEKIKLISSLPVKLEDFEGIDNDYMWIHIEAEAIDYTINEETFDIIRGLKDKVVYYEEFWKFIKINNRWVLDEIRQKDQFNIV